METSTAPTDAGSPGEVIPRDEIPGPGRLAYLFSMLGFLSDNPVKNLPWMKQRYGEMIRLYLPMGGWTLLLGTPDQVQYVLEKNQKNYRKATAYRELSRIMGEGLLTSEGDLWLRQHRLMMPMFHRRSVRTFADMIMDEARRMIERWEDFERDGRTLDLLEEMKRITLLIICRSLFSSDVEGYVDDVSEALEVLRRGFQSRTRGFEIPMWVPTPLNRKVKRAMRDLDDIVHGLIDRRRGHEEEYDDFLSMLMLAEDEETGETMDQKQIRDEVMTFFLAGHETTANALTWTWYALADHPGIHRRLHEHASEVLSRHDDYSGELYDELDYAGRVVEESMRLYPPVPVFARETIQDDVIEGYEVPAGTTIMLSQYLIHRDPDLWPEPERFDPARFDGDGDRHRYAYFPFGGGARMCIGRELALLEARLILSMTVERFRLERAEPDREVGADVAVTMEPNVPLRMNVHRW